MEHLDSALTLFASLILGAFGFPFPEEVILPAGGISAYPSTTRLGIVAGAGYLGIVVADNLLFAVGRLLGARLLERPRFARLFPSHRREKVEGWLSKRGDYAIAMLRFTPGFRAPGYFSAGTLGYSWRRFLLIDSLLAMVSVTLLVGLGYHLGEDWPAIVAAAKAQLGPILGGAALLAAGYAAWRWHRARLKRQAPSVG